MTTEPVTVAWRENSSPGTPADTTAVDPSVTARLMRTRALNDPWVVASGASMLPTIAEGVELRIEVAGRRPRLGEVWLFVDDSNALIAHRYLRRAPHDRLIFVGDAAPRTDEPVSYDRLVGRIVELRDVGLHRPVTRRSGVRPAARFVARAIRRGLRRVARR